MTTNEKAVMSFIRREQPAIGRTLSALVRIPTVNRGTGEGGDANERPAAELLAQMMREAGLEPKLLEKKKDRTNMVVRVKGDGSNPPLLLNAHLDVVEADAGAWRHDPFAAEIHDGYVWGRGAIEMTQQSLVRVPRPGVSWQLVTKR